MSGEHAVGAATARWAACVFAATVVLQRVALPGMPNVSILVPVVVGAAAYAVLRGLAVVDRRRFVLWLVAAGSTGLAILVQYRVVDRPLISLTSWALFVIVWLPAVLTLVDRSRRTYLAVLRRVVAVTSFLAVGSVAMVAVQLAGVRYEDWMARLLPSGLVMRDFVITYPVSYGSELYKSNAFIGLEPSIVSAQLGVGIVCALLVRARPLTVLLLGAGLLCTVAGSGLAIVAVALVVMVVHPIRARLRRYLVLGAAGVVAAVATPFGATLWSRVGEVSSNSSSTSLRAVLPYQYFWPSWSHDVPLALFGGGPGSSQRLVEQSGVLGLLVPTPIKIFFDYGLITGMALAALLLFAYVGGPSRALSVSLFVSLWTLQPGTTTMVLVALVLLTVTWWSPRAGDPLESAEQPTDASLDGSAIIQSRVPQESLT